MRLAKKHEGRPVDFRSDDRVINGRIRKVRRGIATIEYWLQEKWNAEPFITYIESKDNRILEVY